MASEVIESINSNLKQQLYGMKIPRSEDRAKFVREQLKQSIRQTFAKTKSVNVIELIRAKAKTSNKDGSSPYVILFLGINGTGKTTTVAKFANMLKKNKISVVLACADTHRAGAIEQLSEHANRLGLKAISSILRFRSRCRREGRATLCSIPQNRRSHHRFCRAYSDKSKSHGRDGQNCQGRAARPKNLRR